LSALQRALPFTTEGKEVKKLLWVVVVFAIVSIIVGTVSAITGVNPIPDWPHAAYALVYGLEGAALGIIFERV